MRRTAAVLSLPLAALITLTGCGSSGKSKPGRTTAAAAECGKVDTAGGVSAYLKVTRGSVSCGEAVSIYKAFFAEIAAGKAPGQGSGGGLPVQGWSCVIHPPDQIRQNGRGADCTKGGTTVTAFQEAR